MSDSGYIKIHRKILSWEWYTDVNTRALFFHCLVKANWVDKNWRGILIKRGSFITSYQKLATENGMTVQSVRTSLKRLKSTQELTQSSNPQYTVIVVNNYDLYQEGNTVPNKQLTNDQQTTNKQLTTTNNNKHYKHYKKNTYTLKFLKNNKEEIQAEAFKKYSNKNCRKAIDDFIEYCDINSTKYKNHKLAFFKWVREDRFNKYGYNKAQGIINKSKKESIMIPDKSIRTGLQDSASILDINKYKNG